MAQHAKDKNVTYDNQRHKIEKLMENPDKLIEIPDSSLSSGKRYEPPDFVRNVMGSSAGAGSGEFHVYRHLRRKEMIRLKQIEEDATREQLDAEFKAKLEQIKNKSAERTLKKKLKRDRKKAKLKEKHKVKSEKDQIQSDSE